MAPTEHDNGCATDLIHYSRDGDVARIAFNRPERLNALTRETIAALSSALDRALDEGARALLLTGEGRAFCSGFDLKSIEIDVFAREVELWIEKDFNPCFAKLADFPIPVVTAVNGPAAGAGCSLALYGDFVVAARSAYFFQSFANIGLVPDAGATWLIPRLVGLQRAAEMMLLGERITAECAAQWGMIHKCVDDEAVADTALDLAQRLANGATTSYRLIRSGMRHALSANFADTIAMEARHQGIAAKTDDCHNGITAFLERRPPTFRGR